MIIEPSEKEIEKEIDKKISKHGLNVKDSAKVKELVFLYLDIIKDQRGI